MSGNILANLESDAFQRCFIAWVASVTGMPESVIAIDGKTLRRSRSVRLFTTLAGYKSSTIGQG
jgi:hypothetical protein